jgi:DNA repair exonuclease SbcCD nuclease subunit
VILPGNHDPVVQEAVYHRMAASLAANVHVLGVTHHDAVLFPSLDLEVWGRAHDDYADMIPFERVRPRTTRWQIAMGHGHYHPLPDRSTPLRPSWLIGDAELAATQSDYVALGHWNRAARVGDGTVHAYYSGAPDYEGTVNLVRLTAQGQVIVQRESVECVLEAG